MIQPSNLGSWSKTLHGLDASSGLCASLMELCHVIGTVLYKYIVPSICQVRIYYCLPHFLLADLSVRVCACTTLLAGSTRTSASRNNTWSNSTSNLGSISTQYHWPRQTFRIVQIPSHTLKFWYKKGTLEKLFFLVNNFRVIYKATFWP